MSFKLAIIGLGRISDAHLNGVRRLNQTQKYRQINVSAVVDSFPGRAPEWVQKHFASVHHSQRPAIVTDYQSLLSGPNKPDLVSILLPQHLHREVATAFLEAGVAVQIQKPLGLGLADARELIVLADKTQTPFVVCTQSVLGRPTRLHLEYLRSGRQIGTPTFMLDQTVIDLKGGFYLTPWRHLKSMAGAGLLLDHGVHRVRWMLEAFGPCATAYAQIRQVEPTREDQRWGKVDVDTEDVAAAILTFKSGLIAQLSIVAAGRGGPHRHAQVWASKGSYLKEKCILAGETEPRDPDLDQNSVPLDVPTDPYAHSYLELLQKIENRQTRIAGDPRLALLAQAVIYACLESATTAKPIPIDDILIGRATDYEQTVWSARKSTPMPQNNLT